MLALLIRLMINLGAPLLAYVLLRPHVHSGIIALVLGAAVPVACTGGVLLWRRRLDAIGVFAIACFAFGLLVVVAAGGNELVFKLREDIWSGLLGLACLISVAIRRPLFVMALRLAARRSPDIAERASSPQARRISTVITGAIGVILLVHALAIVTLALTTSTTTFLAVKGLLSLAIVGGGVAVLVLWIRHQYASQANRLPGTRLPGLQHPAASIMPPAGANGMTRTAPSRKKDHHVHRHYPQNRRH